MSGRDERNNPMGIPDNPMMPFGTMPMPQMPQETGEVDLDEKTNEVILGLKNKLIRHMQQQMVTKGREIPDTTALWNEALGLVDSLKRFIRDEDGSFYEDGTKWEDLVVAIEPIVDKLRNWQGIIGLLAVTMELGQLLLASLHSDIIKAKEMDKRALVNESILQMFRLKYESQNLESMKGAFSAQPSPAILGQANDQTFI